MSGGHPAGSTALSLDRRHLHQKPAGRAYRFHRCNSGCRGECRRQARSSRACDRRIRSVRREIGAPSPISCPASPFWKDFLRSLTTRGLRGVKLVQRKIDPRSIFDPPHPRRSQGPAGRHREPLAANEIRRLPQSNQCITDGVILALTLAGRGYGGWRLTTGRPIAWRRGLFRPQRPTCGQRPGGMLATPPRHRHQFVEYSTFLASPRESIPLRHRCYDLAPRPC